MPNTILVMLDGNWLSHVSRPFEIAKALRREGHHVLFAGDGAYMRLPREAGFEIRPLATVAPEQIMRNARQGRLRFYEDRHLAQLVPAEEALLAEIRPDVVLGDFRPSLSVSCELAQIPLAAVLNAGWTNHYGVRRPAPEHSAFTRWLGGWLATWMMPSIEAAVLWADGAPFRRYRRKRGLRPRGNVLEHWRGDLNLIVDTPEYGPSLDTLPRDHRYIGPIVWEPEMEPPTWIDNLDPGRPTIYFTMGSTGHAHFFDTFIDYARSSDYQIVMTTAGMVEPTGLPANVFACDFAPGTLLMEKSDLVVCHGGNGTIYQAMAAGVPIVGIPTLIDQDFNMARVVDLGLGFVVPERRFRTETLRAAIDEVLGEERYRARAREASAAVAEFDAPQTAAQLIADLAEAAGAAAARPDGAGDRRAHRESD